MNAIKGDGQAVSRIAAGRIPTDRELGIRRPGPYPMGLMAILATVAMLFAAFTAALLVRRTGTDWTPVPLPLIVWWNTLALIASSAALEVARAQVRREDTRGAAGGLVIAGLLGALFLLGQIVAWRTLAARGVFLSSNPHSAFFYMLSALHGAHVLGGLIALGWTLRRALAGAYTRAHHAGFNHAAIYWHFVGAVWVYLLAVLSML